MDNWFDYGDEDEVEGVEHGLDDFQGDLPDEDELEEDEGEALIWGTAEGEAFEAYNDYLEDY